MDFFNYMIKYFVLYTISIFVYNKFIDYKIKRKEVLSLFIVNLVLGMCYSRLRSIISFIIIIEFSLFILSFFLYIIHKRKYLLILIVLNISFICTFLGYFLISILIVMPISLFVFNNIDPVFLDFRLIEILLLLVFYKLLNLNKLKRGIMFLKNIKIFEYYIIFLGLDCLVILTVMTLFWKSVYITAIEISPSLLLILMLGLSLFFIYLIKREMDNHYKHRASERTIENLLSIVDEQKAEIDRLTKVSKISHKTNHQIDVLKNKLIDRNCDDVLLELKTIADKYHLSVDKINKKVLLQSTKIKELDEVLEYILNECSENKIDFVIKINGSINYMVKNYISVDKLVTLLSDHLKNAIIAVNFSKNPFRSITLNIGEINDCYGLAIHDTGIEFKINTLINLGLKAVTTHKKTGGTGIGFLTTFDTLKETKATLIIDEKKPENYNYTKTISIIFDNKNKFKINSYRNKLINSKKKQKIIVTSKKT